jgi:hypothetical protein
LIKTPEGNAEKQTNPFEVKSLAWPAWIMGRLGGWKGYKGDIFWIQNNEKKLTQVYGLLACMNFSK